MVIHLPCPHPHPKPLSPSTDHSANYKVPLGLRDLADHQDESQPPLNGVWGTLHCHMTSARAPKCSVKHYFKCPVDSGLLVPHKNSQSLYPVTDS